MSTERDDGGPAFPFEYQDHGVFSNAGTHTGMTLLDWYAGKALMGLIWHEKALEWNDESIAYRAFHLGQAMLTERARKANGGTS